MLCRAVGIAEGSVDHDDPLGTRIIHVHVIDADPGPCHELQILGRIEKIPVDRRAAPGDYHFVVANDGKKLLFFQAKTHIDLDARVLLQKRQPFAGYFVGNDNFHSVSLFPGLMHPGYIWSSWGVRDIHDLNITRITGHFPVASCR